ncbi:TM2 domain-containing protein [Rubellimicrobium rubrum]|uniref:TM2 domain-containing protein n=1 Tax=Rubellimicrobium rubrum TaxID=2585369 RepID=A0A5C4N2B5_9RHOB|nr:TM2 domain-containing protein [Rubellimicrobium rubrum]TNC52834.1 TM2 domain-containing protein [Rubellimicrobium rubrum]
MVLSTQQQMLIEQRLQNDKKSTGATYALWFFVGFLGGHRFYLGRTGSAVAQLVLTVLGWLTLVLGIGLVFLLAVGVWVLVDAFLIPGMIEADTAAKRTRISMDVGLTTSA